MRIARPYSPRLIALCLALGALSTLLVAWTSATFADFPNNHQSIRFEPLSDREMWLLSLKRTFGGRRYTSAVMIRALQYEAEPPGSDPPAWAALPDPPVLDSHDNPHYEIAEGRGWPWPAFMYRFSNTEGTSKQRAGPVTGGFVLRPHSTSAWYDPWVLPWRPIAGGLMFDVLVHAALWWAVLCVPGPIRRRYRRRRGRCEGCGYDLSATSAARCPECGEAIPRSAAGGT
jgi:DNA-binding transcriptional LysR family regulator